MATQYAVKEIYYTIQGEGAQAGRSAVFCRFAGCNLWSGREEDRHKAICQFCDTDFWGTDGVLGGKYSPAELVRQIDALFPKDQSNKLVVCTGGEPMLQLDDELVQEMHKSEIEIALETNGTIPLVDNIDWVCVSPKANTEIVVQKANEIKIVYPQYGIDPMDFATYDCEHYFLQPMDGVDIEHNTQKTIEYCLENPLWKLSIQMHKLIGLK